MVAELRSVAQGWRDAAEDEALMHGEGTEDQGGMEYQAALLDRAAATIEKLNGRLAFALDEGTSWAVKAGEFAKQATAAEARITALEAEKAEALRIIDRLDRQNRTNDSHASDLPKAERNTSELWLICNGHIKSIARELRAALFSTEVKNDEAQ